MSTHDLPLSPPQPAKKLRSCLSPSRAARSASPCGRVPTPTPSGQRSLSTSSDSLWYKKRKAVRWEGELNGSDVTCYFATYSACEYDRTPLAPPSEAERSCVLPARGSRCYNDDDDEEVEVESESEEEIIYSDSERRLPSSPFATPEDSDSENEGADEWSDCFARRRMMFARLCPTRDGPQFEGYRSLSSTLVDLLRSVEGDDDEDERIASREASDDEDEQDPTSCASLSSSLSDGTVLVTAEPPAMGDLFLRLRECSADSDIGTPSLISSADSESDCYRLASPRGSAIEFMPGALPPWKQQPAAGTTNTTTGTFIHLEL